jgi:hypothetical protein
VKFFLAFVLMTTIAWAQENQTAAAPEKPFSRLLLISEVDPYLFSWKDLGLDNEKSFVSALENSWLKWFNENLPQTVGQVILCDENCMDFYRKWFETHFDQLVIPEEYKNALILRTNMLIRKSVAVWDVKLEWEGRTVLQDVNTKKIMAASTLAAESRTFRDQDQKTINSGLASSMFRSAIPFFMDYRKQLEGVKGFNRVSRLVIRGHHRLGDVLELMQVLKARGNSLGLDLHLGSFTKDEVQLICYLRGEEKSFMDLLSSIKELKSSHSYTLVNEFTGVHHVIKLVAE